jgi:hypothetical protein
MALLNVTTLQDLYEKVERHVRREDERPDSQKRPDSEPGEAEYIQRDSLRGDGWSPDSD